MNERKCNKTGGTATEVRMYCKKKAKRTRRWLGSVGGSLRSLEKVLCRSRALLPKAPQPAPCRRQLQAGLLWGSRSDGSNIEVPRPYRLPFSRHLAAGITTQNFSAAGKLQAPKSMLRLPLEMM